MPHAASSTTLPDGAIVRGARIDDVAAMMEIESDREGEDDAVDLELVANTPGGLASMSVVELDGRVVSIATLLDETVRVGGIALPAGQVEMVATAKQVEGRGYVRGLMSRCHDLSRTRGHVLQVMIGIPNFYRQFGYSYSIPMHPWATVTPGTRSPDGYAVTTATTDDLATCHALQEQQQETFDLSMPHSDDCWGWLLTHTSSKQALVRDAAGDAVGLARVYADDDSVDMGEITARSGEATEALLAHALALTSDDGSCRVGVRPHVPGLAALTEDTERADWYYVRIEEPSSLFTALAPELLRRLHEAGNTEGSTLISFWGSHLRLHWDAHSLRVEAGGPMQAPISAGGSGLPLDALGSLLFGSGAAGLEDRHPDAFLGRQADLMRTLFPPQSADLLTFYLPS
jgi:predicted N-acetyltransferase YhbS